MYNKKFIDRIISIQYYAILATADAVKGTSKGTLQNEFGLEYRSDRKFM